MRRFVRRQLTYFLIGFVITFVGYLFVRFDADKVILGVVIGAGGGIALGMALGWLEHKFPDAPETPRATHDD